MMKDIIKRILLGILLVSAITLITMGLVGGLLYMIELMSELG